MRFMILFSRNTQHPHKLHPHNLSHLRTLFDGTFKLVRDRGLDHAVEREKHLIPLINLINLIKREPSKSLPISLIADNKHSLHLPFRPIEFTRKYPSIFLESLAGGIEPHIRLSPETLSLEAEENLMYQSDAYKEQLANRILKLLMITRVHKIPLKVLEGIKWDLGLPQNYLESVVPEFPDYFRVVGGRGERVLELVCWSNELAVSVLEKKVVKGEMGCDKGRDLVFPVQFSNGFEMDKRYEKWLNEWQRLPYVSPYENAAHLSATSDESDRWVVGVLHEILHVLVPKKTEKDNVLMLGEWLGLRSRFKRVLLQHPGIFYVSSKIGTHTVVLREGYKRGSLIEDHPLMSIRSQYIHLMNTVKEDGKTSKVVEGKGIPKESNAKDLEGGRGGEDDENGGEEDKGERHESSDTEAEDDSEDDLDDDGEKPRKGAHKTAVSSWERVVEKRKLNLTKPLTESWREKSAGKFAQKTRENNPSEVSKRIRKGAGYRDVAKSSPQRSRSPKIQGRLLTSE